MKKRPEEKKQPRTERTTQEKEKGMPAEELREIDKTQGDGEDPEWWRNEGGGKGEVH